MIRTQNLFYTIGDFTLSDFNISIDKGQYFVLLGPAGSGKSVALECLCGIRRPTSGNVYLDEKNVTVFPPRRRNIGYVPQDYALFKHLSVKDNIAFGLRIKGIDKSQRIKQTQQIAEQLGIANLLKRRTHGLSGGEKQRTALARALVMEPKVLLLDEPVCALDEARRQQVCSLLRKIANDFKLTVIHVSHNLEEAFSVADKAAILQNGKLQQTGTCDQLLRSPETEFVAQFMRCTNIFSCPTAGNHGNTTKVTLGNTNLIIPGQHKDSVKLMIRPENIHLYNETLPQSDKQNSFQATVTGFRDFGSYVRIEIDMGVKLVANLTYSRFQKLDLSKTTTVTAAINSEDICILKD